MAKQGITIKDIAHACGVSTATVSYVLNDVETQSISESTRIRILHYANMVGYVASHSARALATGQANAIGIYMPHSQNATAKHALVRALAQQLEEIEWRILVMGDRCLRKRVTSVDAILAIDVSEEEFHIVGENSFAPLLCLEGLIDDPLFYSIYFDAAILRERALSASCSQRAVFVCQSHNNQKYSEYLQDVYDMCITPQQACALDMRSDTVLITMDPCVFGILAAKGWKTLCAGSEEFPLDLASYAKNAIDTTIGAIKRVAPLEHNVRVIP